MNFHLLIPDLCKRPSVEETCRADLSHRERGVSSTSASAAQTDVDAVELRYSSGISLVFGETEHGQAGPAYPS